MSRHRVKTAFSQTNGHCSRVDSRAATHLAMPISPAYQWSETALTVTVRAECRGATSGATDVYSSPYYISANAAPFFLELDLHGAIDSTRSVANVARDVVTLKLFKAAEGLWGRLLIDMPRAERLKRREKSRALAAEEAQATTERKKRAAWDDSRFSLGHQMDKDRARRATLDTYKEQEASAAAASLDEWQEAADFEAAKAGLSTANAPIVSKAGRVVAGKPDRSFETRRKEKAEYVAGVKINSKETKPRPIESKANRRLHGLKGEHADALREEVTEECGIVDITEEAPPLTDTAQIFDEDEDEDEEATTPPASATKKPPIGSAALSKAASAKAVVSAAAQKEAAKKALPPPRATSKIKLTFTKQLLSAPARTKNDNADYDLPLDPLSAPEMFKGAKGGGDISQRDPAWLKERGDRYFRMGDVASAEEAYSLVLAQFATSIMGQAIDCVVACYSNRAACRIQRKFFLLAAEDCGHALAIMSKARCVTEYPKTEDAQKRCKMRLLTRRGTAFAKAGVLHRAVTDLRRAVELCDGVMPSDAADRQMLQTDVQKVADRHDEILAIVEKADKLLSDAQPAFASARQPGADDDGPGAPAEAVEQVQQARALYDEAVKKAALEVPALVNRAACALYLREPSSCVADCSNALAELDADVKRTEDISAEFRGMFASEPLKAEITALTDAFTERAPTLRFELLRRRASGSIDMGEAYYPRAATDLKAALKLKPAEPSIVMKLDELSRKAAEAGVELEPLPPTLPTERKGLEYNGDDDGGDDEEDEEEEGAAAADGTAAADSTAAADGTVATPATSAAPKPLVGTRTASQFKTDADSAFQEARLGKAVTLYGKALKADASAEWLGEGKGILFRCQCLANRSACHLKLGSFADTVEDAGAAIAALGTGLVKNEQTADADALLLKLLARRGMALCQLTRYDEACADYARAVELDPDNEQLQNDLKLIRAAQGSD